MDMRAWLRQQIAATRKSAMPILSFPSVSLLNVTVRELIGQASLQAQGMKRVAERTKAAASVSMMDLSVEAEAFGCSVRFSDSEVPTVTGMLVGSPEEAEALPVPMVGAGRTGRCVDAISQACQLIRDRPVFAGVIGPFSLAGRLMDVSEAMVNCLLEPDMVHAILAKATRFLIAYIDAYKQAGANGVVLAEPLAGILSPELSAAFSGPYVRQIAQAAQADDFIVVYHNCGNNTELMIDSILDTGCSAYHFGNAVSMRSMLSHIPREIPVLGNVDPAGQFLSGTPESIRAATLRVLEECSPDYPNFIISSGCDIPPQTPWTQIDAFFSAVESFYAAR